MRNNRNSIFILLISLCSALSCSKDGSNPPHGIDETNLIKIEEALQHSNTDFVNLVNKTRGSVGTNGSGSKVVWSKKNAYNLGLFVSANHVYGIAAWPSLSEEFIDIASINNGAFLGSKLPPVNGNPILTNELVANFGLYHPQIPSNVTNTSILPEHDFYIGVIDNQRIIDNGLGTYPNLVQTLSPLQFFDPQNRALSSETWSVPNVNDIVIAIGYPQDIVNYPNGALATGRVYSDEEAQDIVQQLRLINDAEGNIPYNAKVEFFANIHAVSGMSGGGVFNSDGQLLGVMVRATVLDDKPILRVVRMSYVAQKLNRFYNALSLSDKSKIWPFISGEIN
ncbi:hypothetical protein [Flavobacterium sp.]